ncbi:MAG TPA: 3-hydroxyacyl-CoA dehydrogenase NAD-binding domain-containing protein [Solirubrobacteraceae bacterium]|jgi:3-hydroxyacyl-CoA dehydrogenase/enoyl-CoA hydratase/3-hydroxybutyryl-CoA epimerase|nr:3-hydroxyacyl-CoA dehydrogenase NAD-binding domain-containing protein [Solirubrobacteraceae bacterium]
MAANGDAQANGRTRITGEKASNSTIRWEQDEDGIVVLTLDDPNQSANTMNRDYAESMAATVERLEAEKDSISGVVITSAKKTFFAGGDLNDLRAAGKDDAPQIAEMVRAGKAQLRRLETLGVPVVAAINGAALGGGLEICLACHHRVALDDPKVKLGFPEVKLGLLPGAGGVVRTVRMFGIVDALMNLLMQGQEVRPAKALEIGLVDEVVATRDELVPAAKAWIKAQPSDEPTVQAWDVKGYKMPGGTPSNPKLAQNLPAFPANLRKQLKGANYPAPHHIMAAAVEGAQVDFDNASEIEGRYFVDLVTSQVAKNMIQAFFFDLQRVNGDRDRPEGIEPFRAEKVVVLGAGMMGAAIAYVCAKAGIEVVLKDVSLEAAERGKSYSLGLVEKAVSRGRSTQQQGDQLLARITPTDDPAAADGADLVIEAVFEDPGVKAQVFAEIEPHLADGALLASNTSTLPITGLAEGVSRPEEFIGLHFFSPVDKMPLLEIIKGAKTNDETLYRALDFAKQIKKTPIVVNDSRGFFTSRVIGTFINEGVGMLLEGIPAASIEQASNQAGYPAPVLQLSDELNLKLARKIRDATKAAIEADGGVFEDRASFQVVDKMLDAGRAGKLEGAGYYEYDDGKRAGLWKGLKELFPETDDPASISLKDLEERMLFIEAIETVKCLDEGVIESVADANIGSIFGIGFPGWTGGVLQFVNGYDGGVAGFLARSRELAAKYGERFEPPASLVEKAERGEIYSDEEVAVPA